MATRPFTKKAPRGPAPQKKNCLTKAKKQKQASNKKYLVTKKAKKIDALLDAAISESPPIMSTPPEPLMEEEDFNEYQPRPTKVVPEFQQVPPQYQHVEVDVVTEPVEWPELGVGSPLEPVAPETGAGFTQVDATTITKLIDGMNYLHSIALHVKGPRGLKHNDPAILRGYVKKGRELIARINEA